MTDNERQEMREWTARLMGVNLNDLTNLPDGLDYRIFVDWNPDEDLDKAFIVEKKLRDMRWFYKLYYNRLKNTHVASFWSGFGFGKTDDYSDKNPATALMKAAMATGVG